VVIRERRAAKLMTGERVVESAVAFQCAAPTHQAGEAGPDKLTVHDGQWAFCPFDAKADGHDWKPTGGLTLSMLRHAAIVRQRDQGRVPSGGTRVPSGEIKDRSEVR
jgi:hypothetical protein